MHDNSINLMRYFIETFNVRKGTVVDIGSQDINGSYRSLFPDMEYIGVDISQGKNVDMIMDSPSWQKMKNVDFVISGQTFEHVEDIPKLLNSIFEALKPGGLLCIIAPSTGIPHDYPGWYRNFTRESMSEPIREAGFEILSCQVSNVEPWKDVCCIAKKVIK